MQKKRFFWSTMFYTVLKRRQIRIWRIWSLRHFIEAILSHKSSCKIRCKFRCKLEKKNFIFMYISQSYAKRIDAFLSVMLNKTNYIKSNKKRSLFTSSYIEKKYYSWITSLSRLNVSWKEFYFNICVYRFVREPACFSRFCVKTATNNDLEDMIFILYFVEIILSYESLFLRYLTYLWTKTSLTIR